jgi:hypothetical protein
MNQQTHNRAGDVAHWLAMPSMHKALSSIPSTAKKPQKKKKPKKLTISDIHFFKN